MTCGRTIAVIAVFFAMIADGQEAPPLRLLQTVPLPGVEGRIDHLAIDVKGERLFVAALGNDTVEVIDLRTGTRIHSIAGLHEPQGVSCAAQVNRLFVANGRSGTVDVFDGTTFNAISSVELSDDADNVRYDSADQRLYVGYGNGALGIIDAEHTQRVGDIALAGHPESFQLEIAGPRIFVNVPSARHIAVVDRHERRVVATWPLSQAQGNFPMALDEAHQRLLVGVRQPARLIVFDTGSGKPVSDIAIVGDADDLFYDAARRRIYVSGGQGVIDVIGQQGPDRYTILTQVPTAPGARTSLFVPELHRLYVALPHRRSEPAEIRAFAAEP
jgi:DNA-binding beta-propeller fold protein YncE